MNVRRVAIAHMHNGTIANKNERGYGFIKREEGDKDLFFHANELKNISFDDLQPGDPVTFDIGEGPKGPNAINVNKV